MITATAPAPVEPPDPAPAEAARARLSTLEHGPTALGELADLAIWAASVRGECPAPPFTRPRCLLLAADHGVASVATLPRVRALLDGTGPQTLLARTAGVDVRLVDVGLDSTPVAGVEARRVRGRSGAIDTADALTPDEVLDAVALGRQLVDEEVDSGTDLLIPAAVGIDAALPAISVIATLSRTEPIWALGFGAITDDAEWSRWCGVIRDARRRAGTGDDEPFRLLAVIGGADLAVLTGVLLQAAVRRTPVLIDGVTGAAAGLLAREIAPDAPHWWRAPQRTGAAAERTALEMLQLEPSVSLGLRLGEGCGALATVPLLQTAVTALAELSSEPPPPPTPEPPPAVPDDEPVRDDPWPDRADA
jgi:nicotinate-nucleotide--dimethylbenzimidazole phosphoribosyltransferase